MVADWSSLTPDEQATVVSANWLQVATFADVLALDLTPQGDITDRLALSDGFVQWQGNATVHRGCSVDLDTTLDWGNQLLGITQQLTDPKSGLSVSSPLGVFYLTTPVMSPSQTRLDGSPTVSATGQDRLALLQRPIDASYSVAAGANVLGAIRQVFVDAGLSSDGYAGVLLDSSRADATVPSGMNWPRVAASSSTSTDYAVPPDVTADSSSALTTFLTVVNDLLQLVTYRGCWCDGLGRYRGTPYADPATASPSFAFSTIAGVRTSAIEPGHQITQDLYQVPNEWVFIQSNLADTDGVSTAPAEGAGIYTVTNQSSGPSSIDARGGLKWAQPVSLTAASQDDLQAQGDAYVAKALRNLGTATVTTVPYIGAGHFDCFTFADAALDGGLWKVQATSWKTPFDGTGTQWGWEQVA